MNTANKLESILQDYSSSHQNPVNQKIHKICVPLIMWSLLGLMSLIPGPLNWAYVLSAAGLLYYAQFRNASLYKAVLILLIPMLVSLQFLKNYDYKLWLSIFICAWIGQFIGHTIEGKKPSFFKDIFFLLIGPLWVLKALIRPNKGA